MSLLKKKKRWIVPGLWDVFSIPVMQNILNFRCHVVIKNISLPLPTLLFWLSPFPLLAVYDSGSGLFELYFQYECKPLASKRERVCQIYLFLCSLNKLEMSNVPSSRRMAHIDTSPKPTGSWEITVATHAPVWVQAKLPQCFCAASVCIFRKVVLLPLKVDVFYSHQAYWRLCGKRSLL